MLITNISYLVRLFGERFCINDGNIDVGDACWRRNILATTRYSLYHIGDRLVILVANINFFYISLGQQYSKDFTSIEIQSLKSADRHQL